MITRQHGRPTAPRSPEHWAALLAGYRRARAAAPGEHGRSAAVLGHEIALGAPAALAAALFDPAAGPGAADERDGWVGPLWEVLARRHSWAVLEPLALPEPVRTLVAHTRVLLGERLTADQAVDQVVGRAGDQAVDRASGRAGDQAVDRASDRAGDQAVDRASDQPAGRGAGRAVQRAGKGTPAGPAPLDLRPWEAAGWEPAARVTVYGRDGRAATAHFPLPDSREDLAPVHLPPPARLLPGPVRPATAALAALADWLDARCTMGTAPQAAALLCPAARNGPVTAGYLPFAAAYPALVRAGSGAGPHGPSRGAARGRLAVWRALAAMADPLGRCRPAEVDALVARMRCFTWCEPADEIWHLHLALEDPATGLAWAVSGRDDG